MRRGPRIEGVYKLCQTYFVQFNVAGLLVESKELEKTFGQAKIGTKIRPGLTLHVVYLCGPQQRLGCVSVTSVSL